MNDRVKQQIHKVSVRHQTDILQEYVWIYNNKMSYAGNISLLHYTEMRYIALRRTAAQHFPLCCIAYCVSLVKLSD